MASALVCGEERMAISTVGNEGGGSTLEDFLFLADFDDVLALFAEVLLMGMEELGEDTALSFETLLLLCVIAIDFTLLGTGSDLETTALETSAARKGFRASTATAAILPASFVSK
mmetsp:Transcript_30688/g.62652  ORF Transcript_30688/g.62652 Transcript_30688/m.62652 type:complete len:115 (+) Transcript_30688:1152-1496(+)